MLDEYFSAHDPKLFGLAILASIALCLSAFALVPGAPFRQKSVALMRSALAGAVLGAAVWVTFLLSLAAFFPFLNARIPLPAAVLSVLLAGTGGVAGVILVVHGERGMRNTVLAGSVLSASASCMLFVSMSALADPLVLGYEIKGVLAAMVVCTLVCGLAMRRLRNASSGRARMMLAVVIGLALPALDFASLSSILPFTEWETVAATPGALALQPVTVVFLSEFVAVLALTRAGVAVDRQSAARARRENERLRQLADCTFEGILVHRAGEIVDANRAFCTMIGLPLDGIRGHPLARFVAGVEGGQDGQPRELSLVSAQGEAVPVEVLSGGIALGDDGGEVLAVRDIRERKAAEQSAWNRQRVLDLQREAEELRERQRIAEEASRAKSAFLAMMSHEIRTPMNAVLGLAASLLDEPLSHEQRKVVLTIRESGDNLMRILNDILDFSKLDAGRMRFEHASFSLATLLEEMRSVHGPQAVRKGLALRIEGASDLPDRLDSDGGRIRQVLSNLVSNAIKFTDQGSVVVTCRCLERGSDKVWMEWSVADSGIGIAPEKLKTLFDPFVQADDSITRRFGGSGLGLAISRQIVEQMGGEISVESTEGRGSLFCFRLRTRLAPPDATVALSVAGVADTLDRRLAALGRPANILVAEDDRTNQFVLLRMLKGLPIEIDVANDGQEAVQRAEIRRYDLICMDMRMPEMDGLTATRLIRGGPGLSRTVPIIALTANAFPEDMAACRTAGMTDFVAKPLIKRVLLGAIVRGLDTAAADQSCPAPAG